MASIRDVAARAGVSAATVSRVLNHHPAVSPATRLRVLDAVSALGYRPQAVIRPPRTDPTRTLGLVVSDLLNPYFAELARAVEDAARTLGYSVVIGDADGRAELQDHHVRSLLDRRVDGLLVTPTHGGTALRESVHAGGAVVFVDRWLSTVDAPVVRADGRAAIRELVAHLRTLGHRRIAIISGPTATTTGSERIAAFREALRQQGLVLPLEYLFQGDFRAAGGRRAIARFLELPEPPHAVFAADNLMALGALDELRSRGLRVPDDLALAAFDDVPWFRHTDPPITAISQPTTELGHRAVRTLVDLVEGRPATSVSLAARLIVRRSCGGRGGDRDDGG